MVTPKVGNDNGNDNDYDNDALKIPAQNLVTNIDDFLLLTMMELLAVFTQQQTR